MSSAGTFPLPQATRAIPRFAPALPDLFFAVLMLARFGSVDAWQSLLGDGDTGWHIRTGEYVLQHGVPSLDVFSFSRPGQPWFAWEWLSDLIFALLHRSWGLAGVAALAALLICLAPVLLLGWLMRRGAGAWIALPVTLAVSSAAGVHYLARPHLFSLVLLVIGLWVLDEDRRNATPWLWTLAPMAGLWANLHGGFVAWLGILGWLVLTSGFQRNWSASRRYGLLSGLSLLATLVNPYGWELHRHVWEFLRSGWIVQHVQEFQSPQIRSESMVVFALLLLAGTAAASMVWERATWFEAGLVPICGFAALRSARYVPFYAVAAAPVIASYAAAYWERYAARANSRSLWRALRESSQALGAGWRFTGWLPVLAAAALAAVLPFQALADFPSKTFPVDAVDRNLILLRSPAGGRLLSSDQWSDYLVYRLSPQVRVFFDGRSDFYGETVGEDYRALLLAGPRWREVMERYHFTAALLPADWPLAQILAQSPGWRVVYRDGQAGLLVRDSGGNR